MWTPPALTALVDSVKRGALCGDHQHSRLNFLYSMYIGELKHVYIPLRKMEAIYSGYTYVRIYLNAVYNYSHRCGWWQLSSDR